MKYIFIINKTAGRKDNQATIENQLNSLLEKLYFEYEIYITKCQFDATRFVNEYCSLRPDEQTCFVACGGDGTLNEVVEGMAGKPNKHLALFTCGSGNDFSKYYPSHDFNDLEKLILGHIEYIDVLQVNDRYSINVCNLGFEAAVAKYANEIKNNGGKHSYTKGIVKALFTSRKNAIDVYADGRKISKDLILLCTLANCQYVGGKYRCAPLAVNNDGLIEVCLFHPLPLVKFALAIGAYEKGYHITRPKRYSKLYTYCRAKNIKILSKEQTDICIDGEIISGTEFDVSIKNKHIPFILPRQ